MVDWNNNELIFLLIFDVLALSFAVWWLSRRVKSKIIEVNERKSKRWTREEEEIFTRLLQQSIYLLVVYPQLQCDRQEHLLFS